jgi:signal transduction histidine kinase
VFWVVATTTLIITAIMLEVALRSIARAERQAREAELERARYAEQLERSRRLETVGRMAAGLAHDFNNLLTVVLGQASLLARGGDERTVTGARLIVDTAERASVLTRKLLAFGRRQALEPRRLDLNEVVRSAEPLLRRSVEGRERLRLELAPEPLPLRADATQLEQVLLNLVGNAAEATVERGEITIRTARATNGGASAPTAVVLGVIDTGIGMSDEVQSRLFEPFFTTKPPGEGTGLGMASVHGIVEQSGGTIWVASRLGDGTRIEVHLPAAERDEPPAAAHGS